MNNEGKVVATVFALSAFAVAILAGIAAGNQTTTVLLRALIALVVCQILGMIAGSVVERVIKEHDTRYRADNPVPDIYAGSKPIVVDEVVDEPQSGVGAGV